MRSLLQQSIELLRKQGASVSEVDQLRDHLADLAGLNNQLFAAAAEHRRTVSARLGHMRKGKSALGGYANKRQGNKPRFLSSNG